MLQGLLYLYDQDVCQDGMALGRDVYDSVSAFNEVSAPEERDLLCAMEQPLQACKGVMHR